MPNVEGPIYTPETAHEAVILRAYCESRFPVGRSTTGPKSVTGENYVQFCRTDCLSAEGAREHAQGEFDLYSEDRKGVLYWRIVPEMNVHSRTGKYGYYMRLLISDKPVIEASHG